MTRRRFSLGEKVTTSDGYYGVVVGWIFGETRIHDYYVAIPLCTDMPEIRTYYNDSLKSGWWFEEKEFS